MRIRKEPQMGFGELTCLLYPAAMKASTQDEADSILERLVAGHLAETACTHEEALKIQRSNLGYYAGYRDAETRERVERLFSCAHPFFGAIAEKGQPTAEEALEMGKQLGLKSKGNTE
jgi:hypothetical protein